MEEWRDIIGYEGLYEVSNHGRVRSLVDCNKRARVLVMKQQKHRFGYLQVALHKNSKRKLCTVHRLVAEAFIPNPDGLPCVNHKDENPTNNCVWNLEWCTVKYNNIYGTRIQQVVEKRSKQVYQYTLDGSFIRSYPSTREAERQTGITSSHISAVANGKFNSTGDYIWSYDLLIPKGQLF